MSKEQIEEMARIIDNMEYNAYEIGWASDPKADSDKIAELLHNAGYRKQSEGEWVDEPHFAQRGLKGKYYVCSKCNICVPTIEVLPLRMWHFCPYCGAHMKGGAE